MRYVFPPSIVLIANTCANILTQMTTGSSDEDNKSRIESGMSNPAGRPGADTDMAATVLMLAGPGGVFYNEQVLYPDGGSTLQQPAARA